jgi:hypothetical protein
MAGSLMVYAGLVAALAGIVSMLRPFKFLGVRTRRGSMLVIGIGGLISVAGFLLPAAETRVAAPETHLDHFIPVYQFREAHVISVNASPDRVFESIKAVTAEEISLFRTLTWIRRLGRPGPENILNAPEKQPLLDVATRTSFLLLAEEPGRELVIGTVVLAPPGTRSVPHPDAEALKALAKPGFAKAAMNFLIEPDGTGGSVLKTETRVFATDTSSERRFAAYWRIIYPGSALIRIMWLRAIKQRAEHAGIP